MQKRFQPFCAAFAAAALLLGLGGCSVVQRSSPSTFYVLEAELPKGQEPLFAPGASGAPTVGVSATRVVAFLDRPQITLRGDGNIVRFNEFSRWAEPLGDGVTRVLRSNLVQLLGTPDSALPWTRSHARDFNLFVQLEDLRFDRETRELEATFSYRISSGNAFTTVLAAEHTYSAIVPKTEGERNPQRFPAAIAGALSEIVGQLSVNIASDVAHLKNSPEVEAADGDAPANPVKDIAPAKAGSAASVKK